MGEDADGDAGEGERRAEAVAAMSPRQMGPPRRDRIGLTPAVPAWRDEPARGRTGSRGLGCPSSG